MGRLASRYADLDIQARFPYEMPSELTLAASVSGRPFNSEDLLNTVDKVFEVHRMIPRIYALDVNGLLVAQQPDMELLMGLVLFNMVLQGFNQQVTKAPTRVGALVKGSSERTWEYAEPFYLPNGRGVQLFATTTAFPTAGTGFPAAVTQLLITAVLEGFQLQLAPPRQ